MVAKLMKRLSAVCTAQADLEKSSCSKQTVRLRCKEMSDEASEAVCMCNVCLRAQTGLDLRG